MASRSPGGHRTLLQGAGEMQDNSSEQERQPGSPASPEKPPVDAAGGVADATETAQADADTTAGRSPLRRSQMFSRLAPGAPRKRSLTRKPQRRPARRTAATPEPGWWQRGPGWPWGSVRPSRRSGCLRCVRRDWRAVRPGAGLLGDPQPAASQQDVRRGRQRDRRGQSGEHPAARPRPGLVHVLSARGTPGGCGHHPHPLWPRADQRPGPRRRTARECARPC